MTPPVQLCGYYRWISANQNCIMAISFDATKSFTSTLKILILNPVSVMPPLGSQTARTIKKLELLDQAAQKS